MKKLLLIIAICNTFIFGAESDNIIRGSAFGNKVVNENSLGIVQRENKQYFQEEVLFNYIILNNSLSLKPYEASKITLLNKVEEQKNETKPEEAKGTDSLTVVGYCNVSDYIHIGKQPASSYLDCSTNIGYVKVFGNLVPVNEKATLIFDPQYVDYKKTRFKVLEGAKTTNEAKTSYNIATFVNDRKIAEIALGSTSVAADEIKNSTTEYLAALKDSRRKEDTQILGSNENIIAVQNTNTEKPVASDYYSTALINIGAGIVKTAAEVFKKDLPYLYEVAKNSKIYIDIKIDKNGEIIK